MIDKSEAEPEERRLALLVALLRARRTLTRSELWDTLPGAWGRGASGRRKFERDKKALRDHGIDLRFDPGRNGYALDPRAIRLGRLDLPAAEAVLLRQAAALAIEAEGFPYGPEALGAIVRLSAAAGRTSPLADPADDLLVHHPALEAANHPALPRKLGQLLLATRRRLPVTFRYRPEAGGRAGRRTVEPWGLFCQRGRWYLSARCRAAGAERTFRVTRADGLSVKGLPDGPPAFERPADYDPADRANLLAWRFAVHDRIDVVLRVDPELVASLALRLDGREDGPERVIVPTTNQNALLAELRGHLPRVAVVGPPDVAARWREPLRALVERHGAGP